MIFTQKLLPEKITHDAACKFIMWECNTDWVWADHFLEDARNKKDGLPAEREIQDGLAIYYYKIKDLAPRLANILQVPERTIKKELQRIAAPFHSTQNNFL